VVTQLIGIFFTMISSLFLSQLCGRLLCGAGASVIFVAAMALIMERFPDPRRTEYIGIALGVSNIANFVAPPLAGHSFMLGVQLDVPQPQAVAFIPAALMFLFAYWSLRHLSQYSSNACARADSDLPFESSSIFRICEGSQSSSNQLLSFFTVYSEVGPKSWAIAAELIFLWGVQSALVIACVIEMHRSNISASTIGWCLVPAAILQTVGARLGGTASTPQRKIAVMIVIPLVLSCALILQVGVDQLARGGLTLFVIMSTSAVATAVSATDAPCMSMMAELATQHDKGFGDTMIASEFAVTLGQSVGPSCGVLVLQVCSLGGACLGCAVLSAVAGIACAGAFSKEVVVPGASSTREAERQKNVNAGCTQIL
jgi:MFS family permease